MDKVKWLKRDGSWRWVSYPDTCTVLHVSEDGVWAVHHRTITIRGESVSDVAGKRACVRALRRWLAGGEK